MCSLRYRWHDRELGHDDPTRRDVIKLAGTVAGAAVLLSHAGFKTPS
jgi:hypothetical protein